MHVIPKPVPCPVFVEIKRPNPSEKRSFASRATLELPTTNRCYRSRVKTSFDARTRHVRDWKKRFKGVSRGTRDGTTTNSARKDASLPPFSRVPRRFDENSFHSFYLLAINFSSHYSNTFRVRIIDGVIRSLEGPGGSFASIFASIFALGFPSSPLPMEVLRLLSGQIGAREIRQGTESSV